MGADKQKILNSADKFMDEKIEFEQKLYGHGNAVEIIVSFIENNL